MTKQYWCITTSRNSSPSKRNSKKETIPNTLNSCEFPSSINHHPSTNILTQISRKIQKGTSLRSCCQRLLSVIKRFLSNTFCLMVLVIRRKSLTSQQKDKTIFNMTQIILNIEDKSLLPGLRKILSNLNGVTIAKTTTTRKGTLSRAVEEVRNGKLTKVNSVTELMEELDAWSTAFYLPINLSVHTRNAWNVVVTRLCSKRLLPYCLLLVHYLHAIILTS